MPRIDQPTHVEVTADCEKVREVLPEDTLLGGVMLRHSEMGAAPTTLYASIFRAWCYNQFVYGFSKTDPRYVGEMRLPIGLADLAGDLAGNLGGLLNRMRRLAHQPCVGISEAALILQSRWELSPVTSDALVEMATHPKIDPTTPGRPLAPAFLRPVIGYNNIVITEPGSSSNYNSLQVSANRRFAGGIQFGLAWTWSKSLDYNDDDRSNVTPLLPVRVWNYGLSSFDRTHVAKIQSATPLPHYPYNSWSWFNHFFHIKEIKNILLPICEKKSALEKADFCEVSMIYKFFTSSTLPLPQQNQQR